MGISIHYSGRMEADLIRQLCDELADISRSVGFDEPIVVDDAKKGLLGILLQPASEMECVPFLFDDQGRLHALGDLIAGWSEENAILSVAVKTQFAECADHIWLVGFLRYIQRRYIPDLRVTDEGGYWDENDPQELNRRMDFLGEKIKGFGAALEHAFMDTVVDPSNPNVLTDFIERVAKGFDADERE